ncbi:hypothetical protein PoB_006807600 [Plakobranchus ocellatus]|uniref:Uncharacterized protein n=1 Tax=Plakobranchus ocellatus TaxID=259542 RepID=A0AAV4DBX8_9GAST|nr:hypothetical protein PoB_006807600 [Plakobranchus ocellatus]
MMVNGMKVVAVEEIDPSDPEAHSRPTISKPVPEDIPSIAVNRQTDYMVEEKKKTANKRNNNNNINNKST